MKGLNLAVTASLVLAGVGASNAFAGPVGFEHGPNLVTNGGFEATTTIADPLSGWTPSGFVAEGFDYLVDTNPANAHSGNHSFAAGGIGTPGFISQDLATSPGSSYNIHLWIANFSNFIDGLQLQILWDGNVVYDQTENFSVGYTEIIVDPMATDPITTLSIGLRHDTFFLNIDDVSVRQVPEPVSLALLALGLAGIGVARRRFA